MKLTLLAFTPVVLLVAVTGLLVYSNSRKTASLPEGEFKEILWGDYGSEGVLIPDKLLDQVDRWMQQNTNWHGEKDPYARPGSTQMYQPPMVQVPHQSDRTFQASVGQCY